MIEARRSSLVALLVLCATIAFAQTTVDSSFNGKQIDVKIGDDIYLSLEGDLTAGYDWTLKTIDTTYLEKSNFSVTATDKGIETWAWLFKAKKEGSTDLVLQYKIP